MKWLISFIFLVTLLNLQIQAGSAAPADGETAAALHINLVEIQDYANQYHETIEQTLYVYRSEFHRIMREDGIDNSLAYLNHETELTLDTKNEFILKLWLSKLNDCYEMLTPKLDTAFNQTGKQFSGCGTVYDQKIVQISAKILADIEWQQATSLELQRITISELTQSNLLMQPNEMKDSLRASMSAFDTYWRETAEPNVLTNLMAFRIDLIEATRQFNYCLQDQEIAFRNRVSELKIELNECVEERESID